MKVFVLGDGCREHALQKTLERFGHEVVGEDDADLVIVGPEGPLVDGYVDKNKSKKCFGPNRAGAQIEGSKLHAKKIMDSLGIPNAKVLDDSWSPDKVYKTDGLAGGKGVFLPKTLLEFWKVKEALKKFEYPSFAEEKLSGQEFSALAFCDGTKVEMMPLAKDYKRRFDNDEGPNTGGMGAYAPVENLLTEEELNQVKEWMTVVVQKLGYRGVLYGGFIKTEGGLKVLEFNCRFGDPEAQAILPLLKTDLVEICLQCIGGGLEPVEWYSTKCVAVTLVNSGYPTKGWETSVPITVSTENIFINDKGSLNGGRVATVYGLGSTLEDARQHAYEEVDRVDFHDKDFRNDLANPIA